MGILHDYMSCWTTLGPFRYPQGPQNGPKQHQNGLEWLKITRMAQNGTAWPQMALKHFHWVYYMITCHVGPPWALFRGPRGPNNGPKQHQKGLEWFKITKMAQNVTAWPQMTLNTSIWYITWLYAMLDHPGPFSEAHGGPIMARNSTKNGPSWPKLSLYDPKWT